MLRLFNLYSGLPTVDDDGRHGLVDVWAGGTALGVFGWFQVTDFDIFFLFLVLHVCYLSLVGLFVCILSVAPNSN